jgi:hypothetical protein
MVRNFAVTVCRGACSRRARCKLVMLATAVAMLWLARPAESQQTVPASTARPPNNGTTLEAEQVRQAIRNVVASVDARRWSSLADRFAQSVYVDYTSLFGGYARNYTAADLVDNWRQLVEPFSKTEHVLGPIAVHGDARQAHAACPVRIEHFLPGAAGGEEWAVVGAFLFTLEKQDRLWRIDQVVLEVRSQQGNRNLLLEAFAPRSARLPCEECVASERARPCQPPSEKAIAFKAQRQACGEPDY